MSYQLKAWQRVKLRNGNMYVVVVAPITHYISNHEPLIGLREEGWIRLRFESDGVEGSRFEWVIDEVFEAPPLIEDLFNPAKKGIRVWNDVKREKLAQLKKLVEQRGTLQIQINALAKEIES